MYAKERALRSRWCKRVKRLVLFVVGLVAMSAPVQSGCEPAYDCTVEGRAALFEKRIVPLFAEDRPKSCNQCHLSGIDLTMFIKETPCQTMAVFNRGVS